MPKLRFAESPMNYTKEKENGCTQPAAASTHLKHPPPPWLAYHWYLFRYEEMNLTPISSLSPGTVLPMKKIESVSYAGEMEPPPGEGFDPFEREVHGPTVVLDDRAGKVTLESVDSSSSSEDIAVWTCHYRLGVGDKEPTVPLPLNL